MKILLVRPGRRKQAITLGEFMFSEPIGLECVYAVLKEDHQIKILDLMVGEEDFAQEILDWKPDVVGFTSLCIDVLAVLELAKKTKELDPYIITVVGGTQALLAAESFKHETIDHIFEYTTRGNLNNLFSHLVNGEKVPLMDGIRSRENSFQSTGVKGINEYIIPDRQATAKYRQHYSYFGYKPCAIMQTSRGCSSRCKFCLRWHIEGPVEQDECIEEIMQQIESIAEPSIMIYDNNFLYSRQRLEEFCSWLETRQINKNFICYGSAESIVEHAPIMKRLAQNGLRAVLVGYESFSDADLAGYKKKSTVEINLVASKILKDANIDCWASFILNPEWDVADFKQLRKYLRQLKPEISSLTPMTPFPGGLLYRQYQDRLLFGQEDYDNWSFSVVSIRPGKMSLRRYYFEMLKTNLYVNLFMNDPSYMMKKFGYGTVFRIMKGSLRFLVTYIKLMIKG
jgi:hopanoid C-3 methylase